MVTLSYGLHRKMSDGMFLSACRQVAKEFPEISYDEDLLDRVCLQVRLKHCYLRANALTFGSIDHAEPGPVLRPCNGHAQPVR